MKRLRIELSGELDDRFLSDGDRSEFEHAPDREVLEVDRRHHRVSQLGTCINEPRRTDTEKCRKNVAHRRFPCTFRRLPMTRPKCAGKASPRDDFPAFFGLVLEWCCSGEGGGEVGDQGGDLDGVGVFVHRVATPVEDDEPGVGHLAFEVLT